MDRPEPDLTAVEARLSQWQPSAAGLDRDRILFEAGRASVAYQTRRVLAGSVACLVLVGIAFGPIFFHERALRRSAEAQLAQALQPARLSAPDSPQADVPSSPDGSTYLLLTHQALTSGLPESVSVTSGGPSLPDSDSTRTLRVRDRDLPQGL